MSAPAVERATADDLVSLASDVGAAPMQVGAVLVLEGDGHVGPGQVVAALTERIRAVPRLRQILVATPPGCGRPVWEDHAGFDAAEHIAVEACPDPGDEDALLARAAEIVSTRLPRERPLWRMVVVTGLTGGRLALVVVFHHVLADGIGGLAVLASLVDGAAPPSPEAFPRRAPTSGELALDAARQRLAALRRLPQGLHRLGAALGQLRRPAAGRRAVTCSLNRPTGPRRRFAVVRADVEAVHRTARAHGATVNDVVLTAVAGALRTLLLHRGEDVDRFVVSVPVSARVQASATELGNRSGVVPVEVPASGDPFARLATVAARTRDAKAGQRGASTALLGPLFRLLARLGAFQWFIDRQHLVHTFVTNVRGPDERLHLVGRPIVDAVPLAVVTGNVTVSVAVLSYAGTLDLTVICDPDACPDLDVLRDALDDELRRFVAPPAT